MRPFFGTFSEYILSFSSIEVKASRTFCLVSVCLMFTDFESSWVSVSRCFESWSVGFMNKEISEVPVPL